jgi:glycine cleavage system H lipoate-binding protein
MESTDIFAPKGLEYILVIGYLVVLAGFWKLMGRPRRATAPARPKAAHEWYDLPEGLFFHPGHTWVAPESAGVVRVGMDEFALRLLGRSSTVALPRVGQHLRPGEPGWALELEGETIPVLAPVDGQVVKVNNTVHDSPEVLHARPYEGGWLIKVKVANARASLKNLLRGRPARAWMEESIDKLWPGELGALMADGGPLVDGFARALAPDRWGEVARAFLLTSEGEIPEDEKEVSSP